MYGSNIVESDKVQNLTLVNMTSICQKIFLIKNFPINGLGAIQDDSKVCPVIDDIAKLIVKHFIKLCFPNIVTFDSRLIDHIHYGIYQSCYGSMYFYNDI